MLVMSVHRNRAYTTVTLFLTQSLRPKVSLHYTVSSSLGLVSGVAFEILMISFPQAVATTLEGCPRMSFYPAELQCYFTCSSMTIPMCTKQGPRRHGWPRLV